MLGKYTEGEERWTLEYSCLEDALQDMRRNGVEVGPKRRPWRTKEEKRGKRVAEYGLDASKARTGYHAADILVEYDTGIVTVYGSL